MDAHQSERLSQLSENDALRGKLGDFLAQFEAQQKHFAAAVGGWVGGYVGMEGVGGGGGDGCGGAAVVAVAVGRRWRQWQWRWWWQWRLGGGAVDDGGGGGNALSFE